jgi:3-hydroxyacyl-CoA dehydrogenase
VQLDAIADGDLVIEAVFEDLALKQDLFARLDLLARPGAILATNTSYLDVNAIAAATRRPADVLGLHFFSPANVMRLLEVVRGRETGRDVVATAMALARSIGKVPVLVGVCHGFVGNRMLSARRTQAFSLIQEGAMPWDVDRVLEDFGMPMGPFAMTDLAGLDVGWSAATSRGDTLLRDRLCELGRRGQKSGAGYYRYDPETRERSIDPAVESLVREFAAKSGLPQRTIDDTEIRERCLYSIVNEGAKILAEGIALRASDLDVVWLNGYGWPRRTGGPMFWADGVGLPQLLERIRHYERLLGPAWTPAPLLEDRVARGRTFLG